MSKSVTLSHWPLSFCSYGGERGQQNSRILVTSYLDGPKAYAVKVEEGVKNMRNVICGRSFSCLPLEESVFRRLRQSSAIIEVKVRAVVATEKLKNDEDLLKYVS